MVLLADGHNSSDSTHNQVEEACGVQFQLVDPRQPGAQVQRVQPGAQAQRDGGGSIGPFTGQFMELGARRWRRYSGVQL